MNFIEAWKKAKDGQLLKNSYGVSAKKRRVTEASHSIIDVLVLDSNGGPDSRMFDYHILDEGWEIVPEPVTLTRTFKEFLTNRNRGVDCNIPEDAKITISWVE